MMVLCLVTQSCPTLCDPMKCGPSGSSVHGDSPAKSIGVGFHALFQEIFPTQRLSPGLVHYRWVLYCLNTSEAQEYWSGWPISSPGELPNSGIKLESPALQEDSLPDELQQFNSR